MKNKKGLSDIIATLIIILLVIVAAGIIWVVVKNVVESGAEQVEIGSKCIAVDIEFVKYNNATNPDKLTLRRGSGGDVMGGVKVVVFNNTLNTGVINFGSINELETKELELTGVNMRGMTKIEFTPYFVINGKELVCQNTRTANIA